MLMAVLGMPDSPHISDVEAQPFEKSEENVKADVDACMTCSPTRSLEHAADSKASPEQAIGVNMQRLRHGNIGSRLKLPGELRRCTPMKNSAFQQERQRAE